MGEMLKKLEEWLGGGPGGVKRIQTFRWIVIVLLTGVALMIVNSFIHIKEVDPISTARASPPDVSQQVFGASSGKDKSAFSEYERAYESQLKDILQKIVGVGEVEVLVTVDSTEEIEMIQNEKEQQETTNESDSKGASRRNSNVTKSRDSVLYQAAGDQHPLIRKQVKPRIRGVLVVARGAENEVVKKLLLEAVERSLDVPLSRISIVPRKQQG
jgi:stage III sporulation protein AG